MTTIKSYDYLNRPTSIQSINSQLSTINSHNTPAALWTNVTVSATGQSPVSGNRFVAGTPEAFGYDADGNQTNDGRWVFSWDPENRLVTLVSATVVGPQQLIRFEYDAQGRRIHKQVWNNTAGTGNPAVDLRFVYDGWNLLAELGTNGAPVRTYVWGIDLSGASQGAGGVGGLVLIAGFPSKPPDRRRVTRAGASRRRSVPGCR